MKTLKLKDLKPRTNADKALDSFLDYCKKATPNREYKDMNMTTFPITRKVIDKSNWD